MAPTKIILIVYFFCMTTLAAQAETEAESNAASYAALQMRLLLSEQQATEDSSLVALDVDSNEMKACDDKMEKVRALLQFVPQTDQAHSPETKHALRELLELSKNSVFNQACSAWLHEILAHFNSMQLKNERYKQYLYSVLAADDKQVIGTIAVAALQYGLLHGPLSAQEWQYLKLALTQITHQDLKKVISLMTQATAAKIQSMEVFQQQVDELLALAKAGQLGMPLKIKPNYLTGLILRNVQRDFTDQFMVMYKRYHLGIDKHVRLEAYVRHYISAFPSSERYQLLSLFLADIYNSDIRLSKRDANKLFSMLQQLRPIDSPENQDLMAVWKNITSVNKSIISDIVESSSAKAVEKNYWRNLYAPQQAKVSQLPL